MVHEFRDEVAGVVLPEFPGSQVHGSIEKVQRPDVLIKLLASPIRKEETVSS